MTFHLHQWLLDELHAATLAHDWPRCAAIDALLSIERTV